MSARAGKRPMRTLTAHEKLEAIRRVHDGESKASVARDIGVPESTLRGWCKNEEKISYLSRQSTSPDTDESYEPHEKKAKTDDGNVQPYNLCIKDTTRCQDAETAASQPGPSREDRNKAELARIGASYGLNRQEIFVNPVNVFMQHYGAMMLYQQNLNPAHIRAPAAENRAPQDQQAANEAVSQWLLQQQAMMLAGSSGRTSNGLQDILNQTRHKFRPVAENKPILYQQLTKDKEEAPKPAQETQEVKCGVEKKADPLRNENKPEPEKSVSKPKPRTVLDNVLLNNNIAAVKKENCETISCAEALEHGEKLLGWLETCGMPAVTAVQIVQLRNLLNNIKSTNEKKGEQQNKFKVRRK